MQCQEHIWFLGDSFAFKSYAEHYFHHEDYVGYVRDTYETNGFITDHRASLHLNNVVACVRNLLIKATREKNPRLSKLIVIVLDDDLIRFTSAKHTANSFTFGWIIHWLMTEFDRMMKSFKEKLPNKAKKAGFPHWLWIEPPLHKSFQDNDLRRKFGQCLQNMGKLHTDTLVLVLKKIWDPGDSSLFLCSEQRFAAQGYQRYWEAVDHTIRYLDTTSIVKILNKQRSGNFNHHPIAEDRQNYNRFHWQCCRPTDACQQLF